MSEQDEAIDEVRHAATDYCKAPGTGTRYALELAAAACQIVGVDPSEITPEVSHG